MHPRAHAVLEFWFGAAYSDVSDPLSWPPPEQGSKRWYDGGAELDQQIRMAFAGDIDALAAGQYDTWRAGSPYEAAAGIILADQFTRNIYRGTAAAFSLDAKALEWAKELQDSGRASQLSGVVRSFVNLPLMHSEQLEDQQRCVDTATREYRAVAALDANSPAAAAWASQVQFAAAHRDVIARWGRFPHRNALLGRVSTPEEEQGLADGSIDRW